MNFEVSRGHTGVVALTFSGQVLFVRYRRAAAGLTSQHAANEKGGPQPDRRALLLRLSDRRA
jgi:hypothetical protein